MSEDAIKALGYLSLVPLVIIYGVLNYMLNGYVLLKLWLWFAVPYFGVRPLRLVEAMGLGMIVTFLTWRSDLTTKDSGKFDGWLNPVMHSLVCLGIGWTIHKFY